MCVSRGGFCFPRTFETVPRKEPYGGGEARPRRIPPRARPASKARAAPGFVRSGGHAVGSSPGVGSSFSIEADSACSKSFGKRGKPGHLHPLALSAPAGVVGLLRTAEGEPQRHRSTGEVLTLGSFSAGCQGLSALELSPAWPDTRRALTLPCGGGQQLSPRVYGQWPLLSMSQERLEVLL